MPILWNKVTWYSKLLAVILFVSTFFIAFKLGEIQGGLDALQRFIPDASVKTPITTATTMKDGEYCFSYNHEGTKDEPYTVNEFVDLAVKGAAVTGTKKGTQAGPDMTNGYTGTLTGALDKDMITIVFSYVVEGSANKEKELYKVRADQIGLEKLRYPLLEQKGILVPDMSKEFKTMLYARVGCNGSN